MQISLLKQHLHKPLSLASRYISTRPALPVLANVLLEAIEQELVLSATNLDTTVKIAIPAEVGQGGTTTLSAKGFYELINILPSGKIDLQLDNTQLIVSSTDNQAKFNTITAEDFPVLPQFNQDNAITLSIPLLKEVSEKILFAASTDESRPILTTILLKQDADRMSFVATDGYRLSEVIRQVEGKQLDEGRTLLLPAKILAELIRLGSDDKIDQLYIDITSQTNQIALKVGQVEFFAKLINGNYPPYERIIPTEFVTTAEVSAEELHQAVKVGSIFARDGGSQVKLDIKPSQGTLDIVAQSPTLGQNTSTVAIKAEGQDFQISFNSKFLLDALAVINQDTITLQFKGPEFPIMITSPHHPNYRHIIMPLKN